MIYQCSCGQLFEITDEEDINNPCISCPNCDRGDELTEVTHYEVVAQIGVRLSVMCYTADDIEWGDIKKMVEQYDQARKREEEYLKETL